MCKCNTFEIYKLASLELYIYNGTLVTKNNDLGIFVFLLNSQTRLSDGFLARVDTLSKSNDCVLLGYFECFL